MIRVKDLFFQYDFWESEHKKIKKTVLDGVSFDIPSGQFLAILGPNGCGKSTLAKQLNGLLFPDEGAVWIDGKSTSDMEALWEIREKVGMVFQNPDNQIVGTSVEEDVAFGPENRCVPTEEIQSRVEEALKDVGLLQKRKMSPSRLSGGQKQRVAIAGVRASQSPCIVFDEPTAMLDPVSRRNVLELIRYLNKEFRITTILITHHMDEVVDADAILLMKNGKIFRQGTPKEIFSELELLKEARMDAPQVTVLAQHLYQAGIPLTLPVLQENAFVDAMCSLLKGKASSLKEAKKCVELLNSEVIFQIQNIGYTYGANTVNECKVLEDISFEIHKGECIGLIGASGSGKTTLIKHLNGLLKSDKGDILFEGKSIYDKKYRLTQLRREAGMVFQYPENQLFGRTVMDDVCYGPLNLGMSLEEARESARESLALVGIPEEYDASSPLDLSGGEKRRVAIAGVLAMKPKVLILDEPAAGLDPETKNQLFDMLMQVKKELQIAIILVSHHMEDVAEYTDQVLVLEKGRITLQGSPEEVFLQTEYLHEIGIGIPQITRVTDQLMKAGIDLPHPAITVSQAERWLVDLYSGREA